MPSSATIDTDDPITLSEACDTIFRGTMTPATLRAEAARGRLTIFKIGRRHYTTRAHVREMIEQCRVDRKAHGFISIRGDGNGSSETGRVSCVQAALNEKLIELKSISRNSSATSTGREPTRRQR